MLEKYSIGAAHDGFTGMYVRVNER